MQAIIVQLLKGLPIVLALVLVLAPARPARAMPCFTDLANCYFRAATVDSFWYRWAAGLDCELSFVSCTREQILGY
jgi:hypothetical protein